MAGYYGMVMGQPTAIIRWLVQLAPVLQHAHLLQILNGSEWNGKINLKTIKVIMIVIFFSVLVHPTAVPVFVNLADTIVKRAKPKSNCRSPPSSPNC